MLCFWTDVLFIRHPQGGGEFECILELLTSLCRILEQELEVEIATSEIEEMVADILSSCLL